MGGAGWKEKKDRWTMEEKKKMWEAIGRTAMEYGTEVWEGVSNRMELLQMEAGRAVLGVPRGVINSFVVGELQWEEVSDRSSEKLLRFVHKLERMGAERLVGRVYRKVKEKKIGVEGKGSGRGGWWGRVSRVMGRWELREKWEWGVQELNQEEWKKKVREAKLIIVQSRWEKEMGKKGTVREWYRGVKKNWGMSELVTRRGKVVEEMMKIRGCVSGLEVDRGRWGTVRTKREQRLCGMCEVAVGDLWHVIGECGRLSERRDVGLRDWERRSGEGEEEREREGWRKVVDWMNSGNVGKMVKLMLGGKEGEKWKGRNTVCSKWFGKMIKERKKVLEEKRVGLSV